MPAEELLPSVGTRAVHKDDHARSKGPVWEVTGHFKGTTMPIRLNHAKHKLNEGRKPMQRYVTPGEFQSDYVQL